MSNEVKLKTRTIVNNNSVGYFPAYEIHEDVGDQIRIKPIDVGSRLYATEEEADEVALKAAKMRLQY